MELLQELNRDRVTIVMVTHTPEYAGYAGKRSASPTEYWSEMPGNEWALTFKVLRKNP